MITWGSCYECNQLDLRKNRCKMKTSVLSWSSLRTYFISFFTMPFLKFRWWMRWSDVIIYVHHDTPMLCGETMGHIKSGRVSRRHKTHTRYGRHKHTINQPNDKTIRWSKSQTSKKEETADKLLPNFLCPRKVKIKKKWGRRKRRKLLVLFICLCPDRNKKRQVNRISKRRGISKWRGRNIQFSRDGTIYCVSRSHGPERAFRWSWCF